MGEDHPQTALAKFRGAKAAKDAAWPDDLMTIYVRHRAELISYARNRFGNSRAEPEDLVQSAFERFADLSDPATIDNPRAYLFRLVHNCVIDLQRRAKVRKDVDGEALGEDSLALVDRLDPERVLEAKHSLSLLRRTLDEMPERMRNALLLRRLECLSYVEISRRLGVSQTTAKRLAAEALTRCAQRMRKESELP